ncbi:TRAP-type mannitol/chloroaromatic compound transport system, substrate-binding protein [Tistlia consotensis]|uniref:TRAP-type mannitol/chloroaromatic compound transport system, substrate-binding protein n=1 Tax=Tistlia consotensis USBA 355 TaxID=560819 RepID=A0A1Y6C7V6_9PROT|nr:TRAP transporter substrate-binding protein [Tistlia consotensis]SMF38931.1 TRAP-type mannitol/chloroaromatic compound transport system, substrate-binding protein [Tistlia consotensis USBA 355]SNR36682.1 TRAP-type mannitol/chloroaromatic compound transport system, substrate-binding protein [Tistlia consotensis]
MTKETKPSRRAFLGAAAGASTLALAAMPGRSAKAAETHEWKMESLWQGGSINQTIFADFCNRVDAATAGRVKITPMPVGSIVAYNETLDAVGSGILEAEHNGIAYFAGRDAAFALLGDLSGGYEAPWQMQAWYEYGGGLELARELYKPYGLYFVGSVWWGVESVPSKVPINSPADLKGVKIRAPEGMASQLFKAFDANVVTLAGSEVYTALERGVIDATDWGTLSMNTDLGYQKIAKYALYPGVHSMPAADVAVNLDKWNALSDDLKATVEMAARDFSRDMVERIAVQDREDAQKMRAEGVTLIDWSPESRRIFRQKAQGIWETWSKKSPMAGKVYESQVSFMKKIGLL